MGLFSQRFRKLSIFNQNGIMLQLNLIPFPVLNTDRLVLRQLENLDDNELFLLRSDESVNKYLDGFKHDSIEQTRIFIQKILNNESVFWAICLKTDLKKLIGTICLWNIMKEDAKAEIGFVLHPMFQGKGYMKEAVNRVIDYAFNDIHLKMIEAFTHTDNEASNRLLLRMNFKKNDNKKEGDNNICYLLNNKFI